MGEKRFSISPVRESAIEMFTNRSKAICPFRSKS